MRYSVKEAIKLGIITKEQAKDLGLLNKSRNTTSVNDEGSPQKKLFNEILSLCPELKNSIEWEASNLIPGRKFRADILIGRYKEKIIVEFDGFQFHRSKDAFKKDRMRQNLLVLNGYKVLRYFTSQVLNKEELREAAKQVVDLYNLFNKTKS